ncbi:four helix bundle protein [Omnitrophica bacterium]|nr:four helix bundle protein [Candidatus Omnitrophota bacterium]
MFEFEKLEAYKKSRNFYREIAHLLDTDSFKERTAREQLKRAALSIVLNIAEGAGRYHKRDKKNFYVNSRGSINECVAILQILSDSGQIDSKLYKGLYSSLEELSKIVAGLITSQK